MGSGCVSPGTSAASAVVDSIPLARGVPLPNAVSRSVTTPSTPTIDRTTSQRARCWARRLRARRRSACRERGVGIHRTVAHLPPGHRAWRQAWRRSRLRRPGGHRARSYDQPMSEPSGATIRIPRWVQLVGLPVLFLVAFLLARPLGHVIFLFLTAAVIAFMLNPLVRDLQRLRLPRGLAVAVVYTLFVAAIAAVADRRSASSPSTRRAPPASGSTPTSPRSPRSPAGRAPRRTSTACSVARRPRARGHQDRGAGRRAGSRRSAPVRSPATCRTRCPSPREPRCP